MATPGGGAVAPTQEERHRPEHLQHLKADVEGDVVAMLGELVSDVLAELGLGLVCEGNFAAAAVLLDHAGHHSEVALLSVDHPGVAGGAMAGHDHPWL